MSEVRIDRVEVRLRGGSRHRARELAAQLPGSLARELAGGALAAGAPSAAGRHARMEVPVVRLATGTPAAEAAGAVAGAVAGALRADARAPRGGRR